MLLAASESAVTKKPRLRVTIRRSSSVSPSRLFQSSMSRLMLISCGIQWLAQAAMYFSQAHLYLNGTSWLTSALELMICLSSTRMRRGALPAAKRSSVPPPGGDGGVEQPVAEIDAHCHWQASHSGLSIAQNLGSSADAAPSPTVLADCAVEAAADMPPSEGTAFSCPALLVDFSACVAPIARR